jgi:hypothetical protein
MSGFSAGNTIDSPVLTVTNTGSSGGSTAITASNGSEYGTAIYGVASADGMGVEGFSQLSVQSIGVFGGLNGSFSSTFDTLNQEYDAGVWADTPDGGITGLFATADNENAGVFENNATTAPTIYVANLHSGGPSGLATVARIEGRDGVCGVNQNGSMACTGQLKALVATRDGARQVETYSVQSAENWLEDYGAGQLQDGKAMIELDPAFAETVNTGVEFHVFLTPGGDCKGLYVTNKTTNGFEVHELGGGNSSISFDYKIVAKRSGHEAERLVDVTDRVKLEADAAHPKPMATGVPAVRRKPSAHVVAAAKAAAQRP